MQLNTYKISIFLLVFSLLTGCASKRRKDKNPSLLSKFYHNTTSHYNGYFNANELVKESYKKLREAHRDNYNEVLPLYDYVSVDDPKMVYPDLDKAIEKVTTVATIHEVGDWVDDCYVLMGEAQYLKQDYESAEETFAYFKEEFNPDNPFGRNYKKKKKSKKAIKKERDKERKKAKAERDKERKARKKEREEAKKERERMKKEEDKARKKERKRKKKSKKRRKRGKKRRERKEEPQKTNVEKKTEDSGKVKKEEITKEEIPSKVEKSSERQEDKKEEVKQKKEPKEKKEDKTAYSKGLIWYAKTLVQREKYANASYLVKRMREEGGLPKDVLREIPVILADINIRQKNYQTAINHLEEAIDLAKKKSNKARYAFVIGQLSVIAKDYAKAIDAFEKARKWAKSFEMEFQSKLEGEKIMMLSGKKSKDQVVKQLDKMIAEEKYNEYNDRLYYTKGEIYLADDQIDEAVKSFSQSIAHNTDNLPLKIETYYLLANLFYDREDFLPASAYYDSTLTVLDKDDSRYRSVDNLAKNLKGIAMNITKINELDSLLAMVSWSDDKIEALAEKLIEEKKKGIEKEVGDMPAADLSFIGGGGFKKSNFFAYNPVAKEKGREEFVDKWGDIPLEDDWRRRDKSGTFANDNEDEKVAEDGYVEDETSKMIASIKSSIPYSTEAQDEIHKKREKAYFDLGKDYRDKLQNSEKCVDVLSRLLKNYPETSHQLEAYYYLYVAHTDLGNHAEAEKYKEKILSKYPDSEFAKVILNPDFSDGHLSKAERLQKYYEETYNLFTKGHYKQAYDQAAVADEQFGKNNELSAKFALLMAMATGNLKGKAEYVKALRKVVIKYPNTPEKARADEILRFLNGDKDAFSGVDIEEVDDIFTLEDDKLHYVVVVLYDSTPKKKTNAKIAISNYNRKYHKLDKLQLGESGLNREKNTDVILIRRFKNKEKAMDYYEKVNKSLDEFITDEDTRFAVYPISQRNYRKMIVERGDARYRVFFRKYYLGE